MARRARLESRLLIGKGEVEAAKGDFEEVKEAERGPETLGALVVAEELAPVKGHEGEVEKLYRCVLVVTLVYLQLTGELQPTCEPVPDVPSGDGRAAKV